ncbi:MAG: GWxTD domain-containing protein [Candidatus Kryptoniota bacterium]
MKSFRIIVLVTAFIIQSCASTVPELNQCFYNYKITEDALPFFEVKTFRSPEQGGTRLDIYLGVQESRLQFIKMADNFKSSYTVLLRLAGERKAYSRDLSRTIIRKEVNQLDENSYDAFVISFFPEPGKYKLSITVSDDNTQAKLTRDFSVDIPSDTSNQIRLSDILFLARTDTVNGTRRITPFVPENVGLLSDTLNFFVKTYLKSGSLDSVEFYLYELPQSTAAITRFNPYSMQIGVPFQDPCSENDSRRLIYRAEYRSKAHAGTDLIFGKIPKPPLGQYILQVKLLDNLGNAVNSYQNFIVRSRIFPRVIGDYRTMVESLGYIATPPEFKRLTAAENDSALRSGILSFWQDKGGVERMNEYYRRVRQANKYFSTCVDGWRTPMGLFYIVCGPPDYVECQGIWNEKWVYTPSGYSSTMTIVFRLTKEVADPDKRLYQIANVFFPPDMWSYFVNRWRNP